MAEPWKDKERLERLYLNQGLSMSDVAERLDCTASTINRWLEKFEIPKRSVAEGNAKGDISRLHDESELRRMYVEQEMSFGEIADELGTSDSTVGRWIEKHEIETRDSNQDKSEADTELLKDADYLKKRYYEDGLTLKELGDEIGCSDDNVKYWLEKHDLGTRSRSESFTDGDIAKANDEEWLKEQYVENERSCYDIAEELDLNFETIRKRLIEFGVERRVPITYQTDGDLDRLNDADFLREKYHEEGLTTYEIADILGVWQQSVVRAMQRHDVERVAHGGNVGENHHNYKDDLAFRKTYYGPNWTRQRRKAIIRDQARCQRCGTTEAEYKQSVGLLLDMHHIRNKREFVEGGEFDYEAANKVDNLISLCRSCHQKVEAWNVEIDQR